MRIALGTIEIRQEDIEILRQETPGVWDREYLAQHATDGGELALLQAVQRTKEKLGAARRAELFTTACEAITELLAVFSVPATDLLEQLTDLNNGGPGTEVAGGTTDPVD